MPDGYQGFDPHRWERSIRTTMAEMRRDVEGAATRNYQMLALLNAAGRITLNHGGEGITWPVRYRHHRAEGATGENSRNFRPTNLWKTAATEYRGYEVTDSIKRKELAKNKGEAAIIKVIDGFMERLREWLIHELGPQIYTAGHEPENEQFWHGLQTLIQHAGQTISDAGVVRAKDSADKVVAPSGSVGKPYPAASHADPLRDFQLRTIGALVLTDCLQVHLLELPKHRRPSDTDAGTDPRSRDEQAILKACPRSCVEYWRPATRICVGNAERLGNINAKLQEVSSGWR